MSRISSNTLFHFTELDYLIGIFENNFIPRYCVEYSYSSDGGIMKMAYPMVCFCDIPLSQISNHIDNYGHYGIGLSREWVIKNKLNPIIYIQKESFLHIKIENILNSNWETAKAVPLQQIVEDRNGLIYFMMHIKPYEGFQIRNNIKKDIRFYDEREWRFIPDIKKIEGEELHIIPDNYTKEQIMAKNETLKMYPIIFEPKDVRYIIIEKEDSRPSIIDKLINIKSAKNYSMAEIKLLTSKIVSVEQIMNDF